jgi:hypothetical protein
MDSQLPLGDNCHLNSLVSGHIVDELADFRSVESGELIGRK